MHVWCGAEGPSGSLLCDRVIRAAEGRQPTPESLTPSASCYALDPQNLVILHFELNPNN